MMGNPSPITNALTSSGSAAGLPMSYRRPAGRLNGPPIRRAFGPDQGDGVGGAGLAGTSPALGVGPTVGSGDPPPGSGVVAPDPAPEPEPPLVPASAFALATSRCAR